jgi:hypothetical protein
MAEWINSDGLRVRLGNTEAEVTRGGELPSSGEYRTFEFQITATTLATGSAMITDTTGILIPSGFMPTEVHIITETAATSAGNGATINLGLVRQDTTTTYDVDGFLAAWDPDDPTVAGETVIVREGSSGHGALLGTVLAYSGYLVADWDTEAFTAGEFRILIKGYVKRPAASN